MSIIHSTRLFKWLPKEIKCMSYNQEGQKLAVGRADNAIEIWNMANANQLEAIIPGSYEAESSVEAVTWGWDNTVSERRLFSAGLQGTVTEYCLVNLQPKRNYPVTAGSVWCLSACHQGNLIAAGTEQGIVNVFVVTEDGLEMRSTLDRQESKVLCLAWKSDANFIVTGSIDMVRLFSVSNGKCLVRMATGRSERKQETLVWSVAITDDFSIISGDSRGKTCFWDGRSGTMESAVDSHKADILSIALSEDQTTAYTSGVDPVIQVFVRISSRKEPGVKKWVRSVDRKTAHTHDVRSMVIVKGHLVSGGMDAHLTRSYYPPKVILKYPPLPNPDAVRIASEARLMLLRNDTHIDIWRLAKPEPVEDSVPGKNVPLLKEPIRLAQLNSKNRDWIVTADMSEDGRFVAYSTDRDIRILCCHLDGKAPAVSRIRNIPEEIRPSRQLHIRHKRLISITDQNTIQFASLSEDSVSLKNTVSCSESISWTGGIRLSTVSSDAKYLAISDSTSNITVIDIVKGTLVCKVPRYKALPAAMAIQTGTRNLVIVYSDHKIVEYSIDKLRYTSFSKELSTRHPIEWLNRHTVARNVCFDPDNEDVVIIHDNSMICTINKSKSLQEPEAKVQRVDSSLAIVHPNGDVESSESSRSSFCPMSPTGGMEHPFVFVRKYEHLVYFGPLSSSKGSEFVAVEITPSSIEMTLPPLLYKKKYGM